MTVKTKFASQIGKRMCDPLVMSLIYGKLSTILRLFG